MAIARSESAVRLYAPDHPELANTVAKRVQKEMAELEQLIAQGHYCTDWASYKEKTGYYQGLRRAIEICQEIDKEMR